MERMAIGHYHHARAELNPLRASRQKCQACQRVKKWSVRRYDESGFFTVRIRGVDRPWHDQSIRSPHRIIAEGFRSLCRLHQSFSARRTSRNRKKHTELGHITLRKFIDSRNLKR